MSLIKKELLIGQLEKAEAEWNDLKAAVKKQQKVVKVLENTPSMDNFNPQSGDHLRIVMKQLKLTPERVTNKPGPDGMLRMSVGKDSIWNLRDKHPFISALIKYKEKAKLYSTYLKYARKKVHEDGRLHPVWNLAATPSGRFGATLGVQLPPKKYGKEIKRIMVAPPGKVILGADYVALELRVVAWLAGQTDLIEAFMNNEDVHSKHAAIFYGEAWEKASPEVKKMLRDRGKPVTFGKNYRAGPQVLFETVREDRPDEDPDDLLREIKIMSALLDEKYTKIVAAASKYQELATKEHNLTTRILGRLRKWPMGNVSPTEAANHPIQGTAADIMNLGTLRWIKSLKEAGRYHNGVWPMLQIHDAIYAEVDEALAEEEKKRLEDCLYCELTVRCLVDGKDYTMQFPAEAKYGKSIADV